MGHADHDFLHPVGAGAADEDVQQRHQRVAAFQREALLADVLGVQVAFQALGRGQALEDAPLRVGVHAVIAGRRFQPILHPAALLDIGDVHVFGADGAGVGGLEQGLQVAQLHPLAAADAAGAELAVEVGFGQLVETDGEVGRGRAGLHAQRIEVGGQVSARTVGGDQFCDRAVAFIARRGGRDQAAPGVAAGLRHLLHHHRMRDVAGLAALESVEIGLPRRCDAVGIGQVLLVELLDVGGVGAELRGAGELLEETVHDAGGRS